MSRYSSASVPHARQFYNEIRVTPADLNQVLAVFRGYITGLSRRSSALWIPAADPIL